MTNPPKKTGKKDDMPELNAALKNATPRNADDAMYPLHIRFTFRDDAVHLQRRIGSYTRYASAAGALAAANDEPRIRMACIFDAEGSPVE